MTKEATINAALKLARKSINNLIASSHLTDNQPWRDARQDSVAALTAIDKSLAQPEQEPTTGKWYGAAEIDAMVRDLDTAMNGDAAAQQAKLCDLMPSLIARLTAPPAAQPMQEPDGFIKFKATADKLFGWVVGLGGYEDALRDLYGSAAPPAAQPAQEPVAWKNAAIRLGEELSSVGPDGYYNMTAKQWLDWAMEQEPRGKNSLAQPAQEPVAVVTKDRLCRFADLIRADEREACAKVCEQPIDEIQITDTISEVVYMDAHECAAGIRARENSV